MQPPAAVWFRHPTPPWSLAGECDRGRRKNSDRAALGLCRRLAGSPALVAVSPGLEQRAPFLALRLPQAARG